MSLARRSLQVVAFLCTLLVGAASMAVIVTQTTWFKEWLRGFIVRQAEDYVNGRLSIGRLDGNLFFGVELGAVDITMNGKTVVDVEDVALDYNAFTLLGGDVVLDDIRLTRPVLRLERTAEGWNLADIIKARTPDPDEPKNRRTIEIGEIGISDGTLYVEDAAGTSGIDVPSRIDRLDASVGITSNEDELTVDMAHVSLRAVDPHIGVNALSGVIRRTANEVTFDRVSLRTEESSLQVSGTVRNIEGDTAVVKLKASSDKLALREISRVIPALRGYEMQPAFEVSVDGPLDRLAVTLHAREATLGQARGDLTVDAEAPGRTVSGTVDVEHFNIGPLARRDVPPAGSGIQSDITGRAEIDLTLPSDGTALRGRYAVKAPRAQVAGYEVRDLVASGRLDGRTVRVDAHGNAYGGRATAAGTVTTSEPLRLDLHGRADDVDLRRLPTALHAPRVPSDLQFEYSLTGRGRVWSGDVRLDQSTLAGATIQPGTVGSFEIGAGVPRYTARGAVAGLDLQQVGQGFGISALATDRYRSRLNATFDVNGSGGGRDPLSVAAVGTLVDSELFGARFPRMDLTTKLADGSIQVQSVGQFVGLDPAVVTQNEQVAGSVSGSIDARTVIRGYAGGVTVDSVDVTGRVDLGASNIGGIAIDSGAVDGTYANREGHINQLSIMGPDANVSGSGTIALNDSGASKLVLHAETASLERIGKIVSQPLKGAAVVDATVTGNATELKADGTLTGSNIGYGDNEALSLASTFAVAVPDLDAQAARVQAKSTATFLEVGGQKINELAADTTYAQSRLEFSATAQEGIRRLAAGGALILHPDHQEVHVNNLSLRSEQIEWRTAPGTAPTVQYGGGHVTVTGLQLESGDQRIAAEGSLGSPSDVLHVRADNVDVAQLDRLMLGNERLAGRFTATADITGPTDALRARGNFTLAHGAFRNFMFESLAGSVDYAGKGFNLDVRLQQTPTAWLTATGYAPLTLVRANPPGTGVAHEVPAPGDAVDIQIASSQVDLGVVQGFTSYVTDVTGTMQANLRVTGSGHDPHAVGAIDIRGGAFALPELGTNYTGLDTRIEFEPDQLSIQEFKILDNRGFPMTIGGTLAVHPKPGEAVDITVQSENFEVIDNQLADLKLDTQIQITGELRKPRVRGYVEVENGTIFIDRLVEQLTAEPYATSEADVASLQMPDAAAAEVATATPAVPAPASDAGSTPSVFDALDLEVALAVPSNLVVRGTDIKPANAPLEIGDMSVTVGGAIQLRKAPGEQVRIIGEVNTVRGTYNFQGRRFEIMRDGRIRFAGTDELDPVLDLRARRVISGIETIVRVQGSLREPQLSFSSNPPLEEADILSLIIFNQPVNELGEGAQISLAQRATALAGGYLASGLARSIGNALELDEFEIQAQGEEGAGPSLTVGEQVGEKLFFRVRQGFGNAQATEVVLEYQIMDFLRLQATAAEASASQRISFRRVERAGIDLIFFFSY